MNKILQVTIYYFFLFTLFCFAQELPLKGICAHRGVSNDFPENTISAVKEAVRLGAQMIEFDIRKTKDDVLVVIHNDNVDKTTNGKGKVEDFTFEEIRKLDAGSWKHPKFKDEKIPTFEEVLNIIPANIWMNIHVKDNSYSIAEKAARVVTEKGYINNAVIACDSVGLFAVRNINPKIKICYMGRGNSVDEYVGGAIKFNADFIQLKQETLPGIVPLVKKLKEHGIIVNFYHAKTKDELKILLDAGVDFPLVNNLGEIIQYKLEIEKESKQK